MIVKALADGFYGGARKRAGDVFEVPDGSKGKWFVPVDDPAKPKPKAQMGDTKPRATQQAVKDKTASISETLV